MAPRRRFGESQKSPLQSYRGAAMLAVGNELDTYIKISLFYLLYLPAPTASRHRTGSCQPEIAVSLTS
jgi:hypothetical protein